MDTPTGRSKTLSTRLKPGSQDLAKHFFSSLFQSCLCEEEPCEMTSDVRRQERERRERRGVRDGEKDWQEEAMK